VRGERLMWQRVDPVLILVAVTLVITLADACASREAFPSEGTGREVWSFDASGAGGTYPLDEVVRATRELVTRVVDERVDDARRELEAEGRARADAHGTQCDEMRAEVDAVVQHYDTLVDERTADAVVLTQSSEGGDGASARDTTAQYKVKGHFSMGTNGDRWLGDHKCNRHAGGSGDRARWCRTNPMPIRITPL